MSNNYQSNKSSQGTQMGTKMGTQMGFKQPPPQCKVCRDAGKADFNHFVKNLDGSTNCPTLLSQDCRYCKAPGHTAKYCPILAQNKKEDEAILRRAANANTTRPPITNKVTSFASKNVFAGLDSDESDEERGSQPFPPTNGNKQHTTIKTNNFSITGSSSSSSSNAAKANAVQFPELPKSDKPNYAAIAAKAEASEKAAKIQQQQEKEAKEAKERASSMVQITGLAGSRTDSNKGTAIKVQQAQTTEVLDNYQTQGNYIYDYIQSRYRPVAHLAGQIVGMIMELGEDEVTQLIKNSNELDKRIIEGIEMLKPKPVVKVEAVVVKPMQSITVKIKSKIDWTQEDSDDDEPETDNSAW